MKKLHSSPGWFRIFLAIFSCAAGVQAASVGPSGYTNSFDVQPSAADWSTVAFPGASGDTTTTAAMDTDVNTYSASQINGQTSADAVNPPAATGPATWCSTAFFLQTRPTGVRYTFLMCTLVNNIGGKASGVTISYNFTTSTPVVEEVLGTRVYYSLTGAAGTWINIPGLSSQPDGRLSATVNLDWQSGGTLYVLFADDNGSGSPDNANQLDNFSAIAISAVQVPVAIATQPQNQTVNEGVPATFTVAATGNPSPTYQWYRGVSPISGATNASYTTAPTQTNDTGAQFKVVAANTVSNVDYTAPSSTVTLTVTPDTTAPFVVNAFSLPPSTVNVQFSEAIRLSTATNVGNYAVTSSVGNLVINSATLQPDGTNVTLSTSAQTLGTTYTLILNGIRDVSAAGNQIAPNSVFSFVAVAFTPVDIGAPQPPGTYTPAGNGYDITAGGSDTLGTNTIDQVSLNYQAISGDFDVQVRLASISLADAWSKAGIMARETLTTNSAFAAAFASPGNAGCFFQSRSAANAAAVNTGYFPANFPNAWLRLKRASTVFTAYASLDGANWNQLGTMTATLANTMYVGFAVSSHTNGVTTTAQFRDYSPTPASAKLSAAILPFEPPGPSSRATPFVITEIMYKPFPATNASGDSLEYIEMYNSNPFFEEISNYKIKGPVDYTFPTNTFLQGNQYIVIAANPAAVQAYYNITDVRGPWSTHDVLSGCVTNLLTGEITGCITNQAPDHLGGSGTVKLYNNSQGVVLQIPYANDPPWPVGADGTGHSLALTRPSYGEGDPKAWAISDQIGGSPGRVEPYTSTPLKNVVINEFLANSDAPDVDYIELYNHSTSPVNLTGCTLSDDPTTNKFVIPATTITSNGFVVFNQTSLGFGLSASGETIYFRAPNGTLLDVIKFTDQAAGVSSGRSPNGGPEWYPMAAKTPGASNSGILIPDIVINEIMYKPITGSKDDTYVELYNKGTNTVSLSKWKFNAGIDFTFPTNASIPSNGYVVVARNITNLFAHYPNLNSNNTYGNFGGKLSTDDRLALTRPEINISTNDSGGFVTNALHVLVDEVTWSSGGGAGGNWPTWANGGGSSLELIDPRSNHRLAHNWADSDETMKAPWTTIEATGLMDQGVGSATRVEIMSLDAGEWLVDDIEATPAGSTNYLSSGNSSLESGIGNWLFRGTHIRSTLETTLPAYSGVGSLHIRATARGDTMANRAVCAIPTLPTGGSVTLRMKVRWLRGWPEMLLRVSANYMEAIGALNLPPNLGTPGQRNSVAATNAPPAIYAVQHAPVVPPANQPVVVTARVHDPDGLSSVTLKYRLDPSPTYTSVAMLDNGTGGDAVAGDGIYSGTIPAQASGTLVAFQVVATDSLGAVRTFPLPDPTYKNPFECLVYFGDTILSTAFGTYRQWMTAANVTDWANRPALSNEQLYETFVYGNSRVIYNARVKYNGSPYHQFSGSPPTVNAHYTINLPSDDMFLGTDSLHKVHCPGNGPFGDQTLQREQTCYWFYRQLNQPWGYRRYVNMYFNGNRRTSSGGPTDMMEDAQTPGADMIAEFFPDDQNGNLYKLQPWFEQDDGAGNTSVNNVSWCTQLKFLTSSNGLPVQKTARYRWNWLTRAANGSANEYTPVFNIVNAANLTGPALTAAYSSLVDYEEVFRVFAVEHASGDWDSVGTQNQQNMYGYMPEHGKWHLMKWDLNIVLGSANSDTASWGVGVNVANFAPATPGPTDTAVLGLYTNAVFRRALLRGLKELATGPMAKANYEPVMDAKYRAFLASGITPRSAFGDAKTFIDGQRAYILGTLMTAEDAPAFTINGTTFFTNNSNLLLITGQAPVNIKDIMVNGSIYPVTWTNAASAGSKPINYVIQVVLDSGTNQITVQGIDRYGNAVAGAGSTISVVFNGGSTDPRGAIVINEIMYNPVVTNASYVELYNNSDVAFDLSNWRFSGIDYTFPLGSVMAGRTFLTLAKSIAAVNAAGYNGTNSVTIFDEFSGNLKPEGETLTLIKPGKGNAPDIDVSKVRYEPNAPWPASANGQGTALQLIDPSQDPARVGNWGDGTGWRFFSITGNIGSSSNLLGTNVVIFVQLAGEAYVDDVSLVPLSGPLAGSNVIVNGDFESLPLRNTWLVPTSMTNSDVSATYAHSGSYSLHVVNTSAGSLLNNIRQTLPPINTNILCTLSFWYHTTTSTNLTVRTVGGSALQGIVKQIPIGTTPSTVNATLATMPVIPPLWLNEVQGDNVTGPTDHLGQHDPWVELYNSGASPLSLDGYYLANNYTNLLQWAFPTGLTINPGQFIVVWADGQPEQSTPTEWHTSFRLNSSTGSVAISRQVAAALQIVDYLNYSGLGPDQAYGDFPDGQPFDRSTLVPTPGANNVPRPVYVKINEWVASNVAGPGGYPDPADGKYDDWFELYNTDLVNPADISGLYLTDTSANPLQFHIPSGTIIPPGGFLLVWADNDTTENGTGTNGDLHVSFNLSKAGEAIGLYAAYGTNIVQVDYITFGSQTNNVSEGRYPDGSDNINRPLTMPTPRGPNAGSASGNHAPTLTAIANRSLILGQTLSFTASATDPDAGQTLSYSLLPGFPAGASINSSSGAFQWTPTAGQAPSVNSITVRATDNGSPAMSDSKSFSVTVSLPPRITVTQSGANVSLTFATVVGKHYQVQYKNNLNAPTWTPLPLPPSGDLSFQATDISKIVIDTPGGTRFYRIVALD